MFVLFSFLFFFPFYHSLCNLPVGSLATLHAHLRTIKKLALGDPTKKLQCNKTVRMNGSIVETRSTSSEMWGGGGGGGEGGRKTRGGGGEDETEK